MSSIEQKLAQLSAYASPFAASEPLAPSLSKPKDFLGVSPKIYSFLFESRGLTLSGDQLEKALDRDDAPIPVRQNREGYGGDDDFHYWLSGYAEYLRLSQIAEQYGVRGGTLFDFGGSTGRVFRNFYYQGGWDVWSNDFKRSSVEWNTANYPAAIKAFQGMYFPSLPLEDRSIDLVIAMSVFTHIDETETNWLLELRRVLKPNGIAFVTTHNEATWANMGPDLRKAIESHSPELAVHKTLPPGRHVSNFRNDDPYRCNVFHTDDFVRRQWSRFFNVVDILPRASGAQAIVILRRS